mgnify:CR=1 FL=1
MVFVESETEVSFTTNVKMLYGDILVFNNCFTEISYARRRSDGFLIEFDKDGIFKSATLNGEAKTIDWANEHNEKDYWDIGLRGIEQ